MFDPNYLDISKTKFNKLFIVEDKFGDEYEYRCTYDLDIKYTGVETDNVNFNRLCDNKVFHSSGTLSQTYDERPEVLNGIITPEDEKEGTVDAALRDYVDSLQRVTQQFDFISELFNDDLPREIFDKAYNGKTELRNENKLVSFEFDHRKPRVERVTLSYEDGSTYTVATPHPITNADVDRVAPHLSLSLLYARVDEWLQEDYEDTINILNEIFGFDVQTLKGAEMQ